MIRGRPAFLATAALLAALVPLGCERDTSALRPYPPITDPVVFDDDFGANVDYQAFLGSKTDALSLETGVVHDGTTSMRVTVPGPGDAAAGYAGGAFVTSRARDLSSYDALTFWARASRTITFDVAGLGNDNTGTSRFVVGWSNLSMSTSWAKYVIPIPNPAKLTSEAGLFFIAEAPENGEGSDVWFDDVAFERVDTISNPRPLILTQSVSRLVGGTAVVQGTQTTFAVNGTDQVIEHSPGYFTFASSDESVATVDAVGRITIVGEGTAQITATLGDVDAVGRVTVSGIALPETAAPAPSHVPADVIAVFSDAYDTITVDRWSTDWDYADYQDLDIEGNTTKVYLYRGQAWNGAAIEFVSDVVDATAMTYLHLDVWVPGTSVLRVKLVDFGADGAFDGTGDDADSESELQISQATNPPLLPGQWVSYDIPLDVFTALAARGHLAQLFLSISSSENILFVDNIYLRR